MSHAPLHRRCHQFAGGFDPEATALFTRLHTALSSPAAAAAPAAEDGAQDAGDCDGTA
jgi:hypothetical protein